MEEFAEYLNGIENPQYQERVKSVLDWVTNKFPDLEKRIAWNQPMFTDHGTFIIGFSVSKKHMSVALEKAAILHFSERIEKAGYKHTEGLFQLPWDKTVDFDLLEEMIKYNIIEKADYQTFWRK